MAAETTATKTLEATLAPPTAGKEQRLKRTVATYRRALSAAFESGAETQTAVNDIVTPYTLTSYAKDALKNYVPKRKYMNRRLHAWVFARLTDRIEDKALEAGIPVEFVNPRYTSQTCHACGHIGRRGARAEFKCTNLECWVTECQADINAAANIAGRVDPWGESVPWKPERDDSPRNGSRCDTATGHRTLSRQSRQTTLAAFES